MIDIMNISSGYGRGNVLCDVTLSLEKGEILSVIGPNGCGKSTLFKTVSGIIPHTKGCITVDGVALSHMNGKERARRISYLPQERRIPDMTVEKLVLKGRFPHLSFAGSYGRKDYTAARLAMERMGLTDTADTPLRTLSGGIRQKAYVAMALAQDTDYVLLDEPFTYLDIPHRYALEDVLSALAKEGRGIAVIMHEIADALSVSDKIAVINNGVLFFYGAADELISSEVLPQVFGVRYRKTVSNGCVSYYPERI